MDHIHAKENIIQSQKGMKYWYNTDEPQKHYASERSQTQKSHIMIPYIWNIQDIETEMN